MLTDSLTATKTAMDLTMVNGSAKLTGFPTRLKTAMDLTTANGLAKLMGFPTRLMTATAMTRGNGSPMQTVTGSCSAMAMTKATSSRKKTVRARPRGNYSGLLRPNGSVRKMVNGSGWGLMMENERPKCWGMNRHYRCPPIRYCPTEFRGQSVC